MQKNIYILFKVITFTSFLGLAINISTISVKTEPTSTTLEQAGFIFDFKGCNKTLRKEVPLECSFFIENNLENRRTFECYSNSRLVDTEGNEIKLIEAYIGNKRNYKQYLYPTYPTYPTYPSASQNPTRIVLVNGAPIKMNFGFEKQSKGNIRLIDLLCSSPDTGSFNVEFFF